MTIGVSPAVLDYRLPVFSYFSFLSLYKLCVLSGSRPGVGRNTLCYYALQDVLYCVEMWSVNLVFAKKRLEFLGTADQSLSQILSNFLSRSFQ